jgi:hypothetical protein
MQVKHAKTTVPKCGYECNTYSMSGKKSFALVTTEAIYFIRRINVARVLK